MAHPRILVVDDQRTSAMVLVAHLEALGYDIAGVCTDGETAIERVDTDEVDLVCMDIVLGDGMDGIEAARAIRTRRDIPIVYITAYADSDLLRRARQTRPAGFLNKPISRKQLMTALALALPSESGDAHASRIRRIEAGARLLVADTDGRVVHVSNAAADVIGSEPEELLRRPLAAIIASRLGTPVEAAAKLVRDALDSAQMLFLEHDPTAGEEGVVDTLMPQHDVDGRISGALLRLDDVIGRAQTGALEHRIHGLVSALEPLPTGVIILDQRQRILYTNARGRQIVDSTLGLAIMDEHLSSTNAAFAHKLSETLRVAFRTVDEEEPAEPDRVLTLMHADGMQVIECLIRPVPPDDSGRRAVVLFLFDNREVPPIQNHILMQLYELTGTEAEIATLLAAGLSVEEIADRRGISIHTARTHLKHVFTKTGTRRQPELVHKLGTGPAALHWPRRQSR